MTIRRTVRKRNKNNSLLERLKDQIVIGDRVKLQPAYTEGMTWIKGTVIEKCNRFVIVRVDSGYLTAINYIDFIREDRSSEVKVKCTIEHNNM